MKEKLKSLSFTEKLIYGAIIVFALFLWIFSFSFVEFSSYSIDTFFYFILIFFILSVIGLMGTIQIVKQNKEYYKIKVLSFLILIIYILFVTVFLSVYISIDFDYFLSQWIDSYKNLSFSEALYQIVDISNYTPLYNYFLIIIARCGINSLYTVKFLTFIFSIFLAFVMELIVKHVRRVDFNFIRFAIFMIIPTICMEYASWGQCDAIYTAFCLLAFYFALKKKSKLSFLSVGIAFAFKLQFLFVVPILFVMLLIKDKSGAHYLKWKDIWIAPVMYALNFIPILVGRPVEDLILVYFKQVDYFGLLSQDCANLCYIYELIGIRKGHPAYNFLFIFQFIVTIALIIALIIFIVKLSKKKSLGDIDLLFFATIFSFIMVLFMPKMLDRFYFLATEFAVILAFCKPTKNNVYLAILIELSLFFVMFCTYVYTESWISYVGYIFIIIGLIMNLGALYLMIKEICVNYKIEEKIS